MVRNEVLSVHVQGNFARVAILHSEMSGRQSLRLDIDLCVSYCDSSMYLNP